ncbi:MAG: fasciclin domain-containing protein [Bacteroidota bacterium]
MNIFNKIKNSGAVVFAFVMLLVSCNKLYTDPTPLAVPANPSGNNLAKTVAATASDSLYYKLILKSGILTATPATITDSTLRFTMFVPDNNAMKVFINAISGGLVPLAAPDAAFAGFISSTSPNYIPAATALAIVSYNIIPQAITTASFPTSFPNIIYPSIFNPAPPLSSLLRLDLYPSKRSTASYVNNVPLSSSDALASNGVIHHVPALLTPPSTYLWDRINADPDMTYFKAAILRADSGSVTPGPLQSALLNIGANLTVFIPTDSALRAAITGQITLALIAQGVPPATAAPTAAALASTPAVFSNPALYSSLTPAIVSGLVAYHILGTRAFTVNFPTTAATVYTLIGGPPYPGLSIQATFTGPFVTAATVKGAANTTASNLLLDPTPSTGKSDQNYLNGAIHKIDQALRPQ